jgi:hypothetical protein
MVAPSRTSASSTSSVERASPLRSSYRRAGRTSVAAPAFA